MLRDQVIDGGWMDGSHSSVSKHMHKHVSLAESEVLQLKVNLLEHVD